ncbi:MAG: hypothetical protein ACTSRO_05595 [Candidatus Heimdallarchaeaceae archaeon]
MKEEISNSMEKLLVSKFEKKAKTKDIIMSDNATIRVFYSNPEKEDANGYSIIVVAGWGTVLPSWDEFLLDIMKDFEVIYFESREKASCSLPKKSDVGMDRMAYDLKEVIEQLQLDEQKLVIFGSCLGATTIAYGLFKRFFNPFMPVLIAPPPRFETPPVLRWFIPIAPAWLLKPTKPILRWWVKKFKSESPEQAAKYIRTINEADGKRWKRVGAPLAFKRYWKIFPEIKNHLLLVAAEEDKMHNAKMLENAIYVNLGSNKNTHNANMVEVIRKYLPKFASKNLSDN